VVAEADHISHYSTRKYRPASQTSPDGRVRSCPPGNDRKHPTEDQEEIGLSLTASLSLSFTGI